MRPLKLSSAPALDGPSVTRRPSRGQLLRAQPPLLSARLLRASLLCVSLLGASLLGISAGAAQSYRQATTSTGAPISWAQLCVNLRLNSAGTPDLSWEQVDETTLNSMAAWSEPSCGGIELALSVPTAAQEVGYLLMGENENLLVFRSAPRSWPHDPQVLALTTVTMCQEDSELCAAGTILDADIEFNDEYFTFTTTEETRQFDLGNTMTHELGHLIGFDHSQKSASTMFASALPGQTYMRDLDSVDIEGLCAVYPASEARCNDAPGGESGGGARADE